MNRPEIRNKPRTVTFKFEITAKTEENLKIFCIKSKPKITIQKLLGKITTDWVDKHTQ